MGQRGRAVRHTSAGALIVTPPSLFEGQSRIEWQAVTARGQPKGSWAIKTQGRLLGLPMAWIDPLARAKGVSDLCVAARLPEFSVEYVAAGLDVAAVRARLFDKIVSSGKGFEIDNSLPLDEDLVPKVQAKQPDPNSIWAARQAAQSGTARGAKGA